jgi:hypothetical protein
MRTKALVEHFLMPETKVVHHPLLLYLLHPMAVVIFLGFLE